MNGQAIYTIRFCNVLLPWGRCLKRREIKSQKRRKRSKETPNPVSLWYEEVLFYSRRLRTYNKTTPHGPHFEYNLRQIKKMIPKTLSNFFIMPTLTFARSLSLNTYIIIESCVNANLLGTSMGPMCKQLLLRNCCKVRIGTTSWFIHSWIG